MDYRFVSNIIIIGDGIMYQVVFQMCVVLYFKLYNTTVESGNVVCRKFDRFNHK